MSRLTPSLPWCCYLLSHVDLGEAEGAEVRVGAFHRRLNRLSEQFVHKLTDERPHLLHRLGEDRKGLHFRSDYTSRKPLYGSRGGDNRRLPSITTADTKATTRPGHNMRRNELLCAFSSFNAIKILIYTTF